MASGVQSSGKPVGNDAYRIHISGQAQLLAQAAKNTAGEDMTTLPEQENKQTDAGSHAEMAIQNMVGSTYQAEKNRTILQYAVELVA